MNNLLGLVYGEMPPPPSKARSRIVINDFGRISSATIQLAPLTVLLGRNNSGKSYLATLLWALRGLAWVPGGFEGDMVRAPKRFQEFVGRESTNEPYVVEASEANRLANNWLDRIKDSLAARILNSSSVKIGKLRIELDGHLFVRRQRRSPSWFIETKTFQGVPAWSISFDNKPVSPESPSMITGASGTLADKVFTQATECLFLGGMQALHEFPVYIPAARTGLILSLRDLIKGALNSYARVSEADRSSLTLTMPVVQFLRTLVDSRRSPDPKLTPIADFLAESILGGDIHVDSGDVPTYEYQPGNSTMRLPMHIVSSMVTELTPVIDVIRKRDLRGGLVIEEPEAHLHLSAQRCMARAIARLVNAGIPVVLTTHSDTFVQQLNILMQLKDRSTGFSSELGYSEDDLISRDMVSAYELVQSVEGSQAVQASITEHGIVAPSLNETLVQLADELVKASA